MSKLTPLDNKNPLVNENFNILKQKLTEFQVFEININTDYLNNTSINKKIKEMQNVSYLYISGTNCDDLSVLERDNFNLQNKCVKQLNKSEDKNIYKLREKSPTISFFDKVNKVLELIAHNGKHTTITGLRMSGLYLTQIPDNLYKFTNLETLNINNNKLTELPEKLCELKKLFNSENSISFYGNSSELKLPECIKNIPIITDVIPITVIESPILSPPQILEKQDDVIIEENIVTKTLPKKGEPVIVSSPIITEETVIKKLLPENNKVNIINNTIVPGKQIFSTDIIYEDTNKKEKISFSKKIYQIVTNYIKHIGNNISENPVSITVNQFLGNTADSETATLTNQSLYDEKNENIIIRINDKQFFINKLDIKKLINNSSSNNYYINCREVNPENKKYISIIHLGINGIPETINGYISMENVNLFLQDNSTQLYCLTTNKSPKMFMQEEKYNKLTNKTECHNFSNPKKRVLELTGINDYEYVIERITSDVKENTEESSQQLSKKSSWFGGKRKTIKFNRFKKSSSRRFTKNNKKSQKTSRRRTQKK